MRKKSFLFLPIFVFFFICVSLAQQSRPDTRHVRNNSDGSQTLTGHVPLEIKDGRAAFQYHANIDINAQIIMPIKNQSQLSTLLQGLYDPKSPNFHHFLTPTQFAQQFTPSIIDTAQVQEFFKNEGIFVTGRSANGVVLYVTGPVKAFEQAFDLHINNYQKTDGTLFFAPDADPTIPAILADKILAIGGLDNLPKYRPHAQAYTQALPKAVGSGPGGFLSPNDVKAVYNLNSIASTGAGQSIALFELDGYSTADILSYDAHFGLPDIPLQNVLIDGFNGAPNFGSNGGAAEVTLDIELLTAFAPGSNNIYVYEAPNTTQAWIDEWTKIAANNKAKVISCSWGEPEQDSPTLSFDSMIFQQMAAQGQAVFVASGDNGAYDTGGTTLGVDEPASQPYATAVGISKLTTNSDGTYNSESASVYGGGGVSANWSIPSYQTSAASQAVKSAMVSTTMRNVPDLVLAADASNPYAFYVNGSWAGYYGSSLSTPVWASFVALVNQGLGASAPMGSVNSALYQLAQSSNYANDFHPITTGNNGYYPAEPGFNDATGLGSFNGLKLYNDLIGNNTATTLLSPVLPGNSFTQTTASAAPLSTPSPTVPTGLTAAASSATHINLSWTASTDTLGVAGYDVFRNGAYVGTSTTASYADTGLIPGTYTYTVSAYDAAGNISAQSASASATTVDNTSSTIPTGLTATAISPTQVNLTWTGSSDNLTVTYNIFRNGAQVGTSGTNSYIDTGLSASTTYSYTISASDAAGNNSTQSSAVSATTLSSDASFAKPLDTYTGATAAYSFRKLRTAYTGNAVQLRRASDNTTLNVGFTSNGNFNASSAATFCKSTTCYVETFYDQSGNANNLTQATNANQPEYIASGALSGQPIAQWCATCGMKAPDSAAYKTSTVHAFVVAETGLPGGEVNNYMVVGYPRTTTSNLNDLDWGFSNTGSADTLQFQVYVAGSGYVNNTSNPGGFGAVYRGQLYQYDLDTANQSIEYNTNVFQSNGGGATVTYPAATGLYVGMDATGSSNMQNGSFAELMLYGSQQASRNSISSNQSNYWGITNPPASVTTGDGFTWSPFYTGNFGTGSDGGPNAGVLVNVNNVNYFTESSWNSYSLWKATNTGTVPLYRFEVHEGDTDNTTGAERSEIDGAANGAWPVDTTVQISYAVYIEPGAKVTGMSWNTFGQYHYTNAAYPPASVALNLTANDQWEVDQDGSSNEVPIYDAPSAITRGAWYNVFIEQDISSTGHSDELKVYIRGPGMPNNGLPVVNETSTASTATLFPHGQQSGYWKVGIYRGYTIPQIEAVRYANLEVVNKAVNNISSRITSPLPLPAPAVSIATYTTTASAGSGGSISPSGATTIISGASQTYKITPNSGYQIAGITVNGTPLTGTLPSSYTFSNVVSNQTISATFSQVAAVIVSTYTLTATAGSNGSISPSGVSTISSGASETYTITPNSGYQIAGITVNGTPLTGTLPSSYTFTNVTSNQTISATFSAAATQTTSGPITWNTLKVGAGGYVRGLDIAPNGTMVSRTDTYGAYLWTGSKWQELVTSASMPSAFVQPGIGQGVYEIQVAPSNTNIFYMSFDGYVFKSTNQGATWTQTSFTPVTENANDNYGQEGQKMAIDPSNPNIVFVGTPAKGLFVTTNGGTTWTSVTGVPISKTDSSGNYPGISGIMFDPAIGGTVSGATQTIFANSYGNGVYKSTNGGTTWTLLSGSPTTVWNAAVSSTGVYYAVDGTNLWSYASGSWKNLVNNGGNGIQAVAVNPSNASEIVTQSPAGWLNVSFNGGTTWNFSWSSDYVSSTDIPWIASGNVPVGSQQAFMDIGGLAFNPLVANQLVASAGTGVWNTVLPTTYSSSTTITWADQSVGIEQLVANEVISPPGGNPVVASWDRPFFKITNLNTYPSTYGPVASENIVAGWSVDYASATPSFLVGLADWWGTEESGYSTNGGATWTNFPTEIPGADSSFMGGTIAASTTQNFIWAPADGFQPYYTLNGGTTWTAVTLPGITSWSNFDYAYYLDTRIVTADRVSANTFYLFYAGKGLYKTTNGGATWTQQFSGDISASDGYNAELESVPSQAGNLFFTGGPQGTLSNTAANEPFMRSTNGGTTWTAVPNVLDVLTFGFGAAAPGASYPAIYIVGWVSNVYGIWQSINNAASWTQIGTYPINSLDTIKTITGDANTFGEVYLGFSGSGYAYGTSSSSTAAYTVTASAGSNGTISPSGSVSVNSGANQTFTVTPNAGYTASLTVDGTAVTLTNNTYTLSDVTKTHTLVASFTLSTSANYTLTVSTTGAGLGSVYGAGLNCGNGGTTCSLILPSGAVIGTISAVPAAGSVFSGWSGACSGTGTCSVTMNSAQSVTANFTAGYSLTVSTMGGGSGSVYGDGLNCGNGGTTCSLILPPGAVIGTISAVPAAGSVFSGWSGACSGTGTCSVTMSSAKSVTANFTAGYSLTVSTTGAGLGSVYGDGLNCGNGGTTCSLILPLGAVIGTISAVPATGSVFSGWSGACTGTGTCSVTMSSAKSVTANFTVTTAMANAISVVGNWPGQAGNPVGYTAYGPLGTTPWPGGSFTSGTAANPTIYKGYLFTGSQTISGSYMKFISCDFNSGKGGVNVTGSNITFIGNRFQSNDIANYNVQTTGTNLTFSYNSFTPLASLYTAPPGAAWPSAGAGMNTIIQTTGVNSMNGNDGYQYGLAMNSGGPVTVDHNDFWGFGNDGPQFMGTTAQINITNNWIHDAVNASPLGYHVDGVGYVNGGTGPSNVLVQGNTIASLGNTQALAFQGATAGYSNIQIIGNYVSGFGYTAEPDGGVTGSNVPFTNSSFTGNVFGTDIEPVWGPLYGAPGNGTVWKCNTINFAAGTNWTDGGSWKPTSAMNGQYWVPTTSIVSATDYLGNTSCPSTPGGTTPTNNYTLTVSATGTGLGSVYGAGLNCGNGGTTCSLILPSGAVIGTISAVPASGSKFTGWSGACTGTGTCSVTMSSAKSVTANFTAGYSLTVSTTGTGLGSVYGDGLNCGNGGKTCSLILPPGTVIGTISAVPASGSKFTGWSGACAGTGTCSITMNSAQAVTANFASG